MTADTDRYVRLAELSRYSSLSVRQLRRLIATTDDPLPARHVGRIVLVRLSEFDAWLTRRERQADDVQRSLFTDDDWQTAMALRGYAVRR